MEVVVLGAGFAGINAAVHLSKRLLGRARVTLVDVNNYHLFKPMLHEVATASVDRGHILQPIQRIRRGRPFFFVRGMVQRIDFERRLVYLCENCACCTNPGVCALRDFDLAPDEINPEKDISLRYDYLVIALGGSPNYYDIPGAREHALPFNGVDDAEKVRKRIRCAFEIANRLEEPLKRRAVLCFAVVGAGPTGIELVSDLHDWLFDVLPTEYGDIQKKDISLYLIEAGSDILPASPPKIRQVAQEQLRGKSITVLTDNPVVRVDRNAVETTKGRVRTYTTIWTAGVRGNEVLRGSGLTLDDDKRLVVDDRLNVTGSREVFAAGDCSSCVLAGNSRPLPQTGQVAVQEANYLAEVIPRLIDGKRTRPFQYRELGMALSTGRHQALVSVLGYARLQGILGWLAWKSTYLRHLIGIRISLRSFLDWFLDITYDREAARHKF